MEIGAVTELGRYPAGPYPVQATDDRVRRDPTVLKDHRRSNTALQAEVHRRLRSAPSGEVVLYVHGFNETFATAAYTAAELFLFFGRVHVCGLFTWPASSTRNPLISFTGTTESTTYSVGHLKKTIRTLSRTPGVKGLHLMAHSVVAHFIPREFFRIIRADPAGFVHRCCECLRARRSWVG